MFFTLFGYWAHGGGCLPGMGTQPANQFFTLGSSKIEVFKLIFRMCALLGVDSLRGGLAEGNKINL